MYFIVWFAISKTLSLMSDTLLRMHMYLQTEARKAIGGNEKVWMSAPLSQVCGTLRRKFTSFLPHLTYRFNLMQMCYYDWGGKWETAGRIADRALERKTSKNVDTNMWINDSIRKPAHKPQGPSSIDPPKWTMSTPNMPWVSHI